MEFRLHFDASEFLRQELREAQSRFTRRLCLAHRYPDIHSAPETSLLLSNPTRIGDIRLHLVGLNLQTKTAQKPKPNAHQDSAQSSAKTQVICLQNVTLSEESGPPAFLVKIVPRLGNQATCSSFDKKRPGYDTLPERRFEFVPFWGIAVFFLYAMRRVDCPGCGNGKQTLTTTYSLYLPRWAKRLSWKETAEAFQTSWDKVFAAVSVAVDWGLAHRDLSSVTTIGVRAFSPFGNACPPHGLASFLTDGAPGQCARAPGQ